jgi:hypothetical protein
VATYYWVGGSGTWDNTSTHWGISPSGSGGYGPPGVNDIAYFTSTYITNGTLITVANTASPVANVVCTSNFGGIISLASNLTVSGTFLHCGILRLNNSILNCRIFSSTNDSYYRIIDTSQGNGQIQVSGNSGTIVQMSSMGQFTYPIGSPAPIINCISASANGRTIQVGQTISPTMTNISQFGNTYFNGPPSISVSAGTDSITISNYCTIQDLDLSGYTGNFLNRSFNVYGNITLGQNMTTGGSGYSTSAVVSLAAPSGSYTIKSNGVVFPGIIIFGSNTRTTATWSLADDLSTTTYSIYPYSPYTGQNLYNYIVMKGGTLNVGNNNVYTQRFYCDPGQYTVNMGTKTWYLVPMPNLGWYVWDTSTNNLSLTLNANTSTINVIAPYSSSSFAVLMLGNYSYNNITLSSPTVTNIVYYLNSSGNTFINNFSCKVLPYPNYAFALKFSSNSTFTFNTCDIQGTTSGLLSISSFGSGSYPVLYCANGIANNNTDGLNISNITAQPNGALWCVGYNSITDLGSTGFISRSKASTWPQGLQFFF